MMLLGMLFYKLDVLADKYIGKYLSAKCQGNGKFWGKSRVQHLENIYIGWGSFVNPGGIIYASRNAKIHIGNNCMISYNVHIRTDYHVYQNPQLPMKEQGMKEKDIYIGDDVWVGCKTAN